MNIIKNFVDINKKNNIIKNFAEEYISKKFEFFPPIIKEKAGIFFDYLSKEKYTRKKIEEVIDNRKSFSDFNKEFLSEFINYLYVIKGDSSTIELIIDNFNPEKTNISVEELVLIIKKDIPIGYKRKFLILIEQRKKSNDNIKVEAVELSQNKTSQEFLEKKKEVFYEAYKDEMENLDNNNKNKVNSYNYLTKLDEVREGLNILRLACTDEAEIKIIEEKQLALENRCKKTSDLKFYPKKNLEFLKKQSDSFIAEPHNSIYFMEASKIYKEFFKTYEEVTNNEFLKSYYLATGILKEKNNQQHSFIKQGNRLVDGFFHREINQHDIDDKTEDNPFAYFMKKNNFMYLKELDYKNLEAMLERKPMMVAQENCDRLFLIIYFSLMLNSKQNNSYKGLEKPQTSLDEVGQLFKKIKDKTWKSDMTNFEKHFSTAYSFTKYKNNPFTNIMNDEGHNISQEHSKTLREEVENNAKEIIQTVKDVFYKSYNGTSENGIYDIFQGIADIAYELSNPMMLNVKTTTGDETANILNSFIDACSSAVEIQSSILIYDFLFNFSIPVGGKQYTLNKLDNMIKMFNLINKSTSNGSNELLHIETKEEMVKDSSYYQKMKEFGFLAYNKEWNDLIGEDAKLISKLTGYYLSDEEIGYDEIEYLRYNKENNICEPGELNEIRNRFAKTDYFEKVAMYGAYKLRKNPNIDISGAINIRAKNGYKNIQKFYKELKNEATNRDLNKSFLSLFLYSIFDEIDSDDSEFNSYVDNLILVIKRFKYNADKNSTIIKRHCAEQLLDDKIIDWYMKMLPTYKLIMKTFGLRDYLDDSAITSFIDKLIKFLDNLLKMVFDRWKTETVKKMDIRRIRLLDKERYYYFQAFPVLIDYMISSMEDSFDACSKLYNERSIDENKIYENNKERLLRENNLLTQLKMQFGYLSTKQKSKVSFKLKEALLNKCEIPPASAEAIAKSLINNSDDYIELIKKLPNSSNKKLLVYLENYLKV